MLFALSMTTDSSAPSTTDTDKSEVKEAMERYMPYLEEAQKRLLYSGIVFLTSAVAGGIFYKQILTFIMARFDLSGINIVLTSPYQVIELAVNTGIMTGIVITAPFLVYNLITFLKPALEPEEFKFVISLIPISLVLFVSGFFFGVWVMNFVISIFTNASLDFSIGNIWDISRFFAQILFSGVLLGLTFQFPLILSALMRFGVLTYEQLAKNRPYVYAASLIFAAALPPTDPFSLVLLVAPLFGLFEIAMMYNKNKKPFRKGGENVQ